jgi:hypothetical protein
METEMITLKIAEVIFKKPIALLYNSLGKLLKDNKVVAEDSVLEQKIITKMFKSIINI